MDEWRLGGVLRDYGLTAPPGDASDRRKSLRSVATSPTLRARVACLKAERSTALPEYALLQHRFQRINRQ